LIPFFCHPTSLEILEEVIYTVASHYSPPFKKNFDGGMLFLLCVKRGFFSLFSQKIFSGENKTQFFFFFWEEVHL